VHTLCDRVQCKLLDTDVDVLSPGLPAWYGDSTQPAAATRVVRSARMCACVFMIEMIALRSALSCEEAAILDTLAVRVQTEIAARTDCKVRHMLLLLLYV
jgi:hypothetical protein